QRRQRLRDQAVRHAGTDGQAACPAAPPSRHRRGRRAAAVCRRPSGDRPGPSRSQPRWQTDRADPQGVRRALPAAAPCRPRDQPAAIAARGVGGDACAGHALPAHRAGPPAPEAGRRSRRATLAEDRAGHRLPFPGRQRRRIRTQLKSLPPLADGRALADTRHSTPLPGMPPMSMRHLLPCVGLALALTLPSSAGAETTAQLMPETMAMLRHAIATQTVEGKAQVPAFARYLAGKLESAGFAKSDIEVTPVGETAALVAHYRGSGKGKPILLSAHMDVVAANPKDWSRDPFTLIEENGYLYGRGTSDMKT